MNAGVQTLTVTEQEADQRLDRWFQKRFPTLPYSHLQKLLRSGQIRIDGKRAKASDRLDLGAAVRVPPMDAAEGGKTDAGPRVGSADAAFIRDPDAHHIPVG